MIDIKLDDDHFKDYDENKPHKQRVTSKQLKHMLLNNKDTILTIYGDKKEMKKKSLGVGIFEIWFERVKFD